VSDSSDERGAELRELFFETSQELLQALNEESLKLEKNPGDEEGGNEGAHARLPQNHSRTPKTKRTSPVLSPAARAKLAVWPNFPS